MRRVKLLEAEMIPILKHEVNFQKTVNEGDVDHRAYGKEVFLFGLKHCAIEDRSAYSKIETRMWP
jgi:hypothetical protein